MKYYTGIGSRETPKDICVLMTEIANKLQDHYTLRSGGADGADKAFESGVTTGMMDIYLPWKGFNHNQSRLYNVRPAALELAKKYHPAWDYLSDGAKKLMGRNSYQVLGYDLLEEDKSEFIICWTKNGKIDGGTGQAMRIANAYDIPIYNLYFEEHQKQVFELC